MADLRLTISCEIGNLIDVVCDHTGKKYYEVENAFYETFLYPEGTKTSVSVNCTKKDRHWLYQAISEIMYQNNITSMYITEEI